MAQHSNSSSLPTQGSSASANFVHPTAASSQPPAETASQVASQPPLLARAAALKESIKKNRQKSAESMPLGIDERSPIAPFSTPTRRSSSQDPRSYQAANDSAEMEIASLVAEIEAAKGDMTGRRETLGTVAANGKDQPAEAQDTSPARQLRSEKTVDTSKIPQPKQAQNTSQAPSMATRHEHKGHSTLSTPNAGGRQRPGEGLQDKTAITTPSGHRSSGLGPKTNERELRTDNSVPRDLAQQRVRYTEPPSQARNTSLGQMHRSQTQVAKSTAGKDNVRPSSDGATEKGRDKHTAMPGADSLPPKAPRVVDATPKPASLKKEVVSITIPSTGSSSEQQDVIKWLQRSGYYNEATRAPIVERWHKLAEVEALKAKLLQEDKDSDFVFGRVTASTQSNSAVPAATTPMDLDTSKPAPTAHKPSLPKKPMDYTEVKNIRSRDYDRKEREYEYERRRDRDNRSVSPRRSRARTPRTSGYSYRNYDDRRSPLYRDRGRDLIWDQDRDRDGNRDRDPRRGRSPTRDLRARVHTHSRYGSGRGPSRDNRASDYHRQQEPKADRRVDLGRPGETRFFIIKSSNQANVETSIKEGVWVTQSHNGKLLTKAFATSKNVLLFFSVNQSGAFQGYARMCSKPDPGIAQPDWEDMAGRRTSPPFRVEWLGTTPVTSRQVRYLRNPLNENLSVLVGRDGQEIAEKTGVALLRMMEGPAAPAHQPKTPRRKPSALPVDGDGDGQGRKKSPKEEGECSV
ncbi:hypothetical protein MAPG_07517 [Magnaporthiopsis poae ATCC 64411]|uniref:YTH domain-containing protein n=1 Tax=Magnaporthiopsis poae (strain ATCC 64411 / 73-15) TaxID=644358 RepID=A0A0C4E4W3_MAGP6|nr:hypothetical protein MAPG_07517 [Magnaporthiopsis poae ATCC 64411]